VRPRIAPFFWGQDFTIHLYRRTHGQESQQDKVEASINSQVQGQAQWKQAAEAKAASVRTAKSTTSISRGSNGRRRPRLSIQRSVEASR
jgi:hypothetical protein